MTLACTFKHARNKQWGRIIHEKLTVDQLVKKFPSFYRTRRFFAAFTGVRHWIVLRNTAIQATPWRPIYLTSVLILFSHLRLVSSLLVFGLLIVYTHTSFLPSVPANLILTLIINIQWRVQSITNFRSHAVRSKFTQPTYISIMVWRMPLAALTCA
jgi:hypothetical protein